MADNPWADLAAYRLATKGFHLRDLFAGAPDRFEAFSARCDDILLDYSKTSLNADSLALLLSLIERCDVPGKRDAMFRGELINNTEGRAVLHTALRRPDHHALFIDGVDVMKQIHETFDRLFAFADAVRQGRINAADGKPFTDVINIGIGGSDLGPVMVTTALAPYHDGPRLHFVSNVDSAHFTDIVKHLDPARTLVIIASKTFTTIETMTNAHAARNWIASALGEQAVGAHFAAVSTALPKVAAFGISADRTFGFWDWVGGRYSVWSAIGLPVMLAIGPVHFRTFLAGAHRMDEHFQQASPDQNLPILLALVGIWHRDICHYGARAILPYDQRLARFPAYLQQLDMESNGKSVKKNGRPVDRPTGPLVWGEPGTNGQHAFYQLLHQGCDTIPCEFLIAAQSHEPALAAHQALLIANCLAQSEALMNGRTLDEAKATLAGQGLDAAQIDKLAPHKLFPGNRPSITIAYPKLDPPTLGSLIALYEHRVFVEAAIWDINAFDQWGVELGKELATALLPVVQGHKSAAGHDSSTAGLIGHLQAHQSA